MGKKDKGRYEVIYKKSMKNKYYLYERYNNYPASTENGCGSGVRKLAKELRL
jgi:hypothetical protein